LNQKLGFLLWHRAVAHEDGFVGNTFSSPQSRGSVMSPKHTSVMLNGGTNVKAAGTGVYLGGRYFRRTLLLLVVFQIRRWKSDRVQEFVLNRVLVWSVLSY
jgi:hypothetical protein